LAFRIRIRIQIRISISNLADGSRSGAKVTPHGVGAVRSWGMVDPDDAKTDAMATEATLSPSRALEVGATHAPATAPNSGTLPARYRLAGSLGQGGMGEVLLATDTQIDRQVAIKRMLIEPSGQAVARFLREAKVQGRLDHPAIVPVYELAHDTDGRPFFVMKRLVGTTLADVLARKTGDPRYSRQKLLRAFAEVCLAIELAHSRGVIHRDLKPANIMLGDFGEVYVLDWGIARVTGETDPELRAPATGDPQLTQAGAILGTPGYMAPEVVSAEPIDARVDVFALGAILFEVLAGQPLIARGAPIARVLDDFDPHPAVRAPDRDIPPELDAVCATALSVARADRPTARGLAEHIDRFLDGDRDLAQRKALAATHLEAARTAAAGDREEDRSLAMLEAGRALALDPRSGAADLLGRLMLEPPKRMPHEVADRLDELEDRSSRTKASSFLPAYVVCILALPLIVWMGLHTWLGVVCFVGSTSINIASCVWVIHKRTRTSALDMYVVLATNLILVVATTWLFGPVLIAPSIAIVVAMAFSMDTRLRFTKVIGFTMAALLLPFVLELAHIWWPQSFLVIDGDLRIHSTEFSVQLPQSHVAFALYFVMVTLVSGLAARRLAINERAAMRKVELQAWHLRQLVRG
jgi:serine/threonine-protein kinase